MFPLSQPILVTQPMLKVPSAQQQHLLITHRGHSQVPRGTQRATAIVRWMHSITSELYHTRCCVGGIKGSRTGSRCISHPSLLHPRQLTALFSKPNPWEWLNHFPKGPLESFPQTINTMSQGCFTWTCWQHQGPISFHTIPLPEIQG